MRPGPSEAPKRSTIVSPQRTQGTLARLRASANLEIISCISGLGITMVDVLLWILTATGAVEDQAVKFRMRMIQDFLKLPVSNARHSILLQSRTPVIEHGSFDVKWSSVQ